MRKHSVGRKGLRGLYYTVYEVEGLNLDRLINTLKKRGLDLFDVKKFGQKRLRITINGGDNEKFFAITKELCYNVRKIRDKGRLYPALYLFRNFGLLVGCAVFFALAVIADDVIFAFSFTGSGRVYARQVTEYLSGRGITVYSRFSSLDLKTLEDEILSASPHLSFVSCKKNGNRLSIDLALGSSGSDILSGNAKELKADVDGVIESLKVYRGTAQFKVGDTVKVGDVIIGGYAVVGDQTVEINVLGCVTVLVDEVLVYRLDGDNLEDAARLYAEQQNPSLEPVNAEVEKVEDNGQFIYTVRLKYRHVLYAG